MKRSGASGNGPHPLWLGAVGLWFIAAGCGYDFDKAFLETPAWHAADASDGSFDVSLDKAPEGSSGKGGSSGSAGKAGSAGTGGLAGNAGSGGSSGQGGTGGASGQGGTTGTGGVSGQGGTTQTGGASGQGGTTQTGGASGQGGAIGTGGVSGQGGATGTGGVGGSSGVGGTGGALLPETCSNNIDDNGDGLIDCADPQCTATYQCVPSSPALQWGRPGYKRVFVDSDPALTCGTGFLHTIHHTGLQYSMGGSCACSCSSSTGGTCTPNAGLYDTICAGPVVAITTACTGCQGGACTVATGNVTLDQAGSCALTTTDSFPVPTWTGGVDFCESTKEGGGCAAGLVCIHRPAAGLDSRICLEGSVSLGSCPTGYPVETLAYQSYVDNRTCSTASCDCSAPSGETCSGAVEAYVDPACGGTPAGSVPLDGTCATMAASSAARAVTMFAGGTCTASGTSSAAGTVSPTMEHRICCAP